MHRFIKTLITSTIVTLLCSFPTVGYGIKFVNNQYVPADYVVLADQITEQVKERLTKRYNMRVIGVTKGMADCVNVLGLSFQIKGPLSLDELRRIVVNCVEEYLFLINENEKLRPFLKNYPFTSKELIISIFVIDRTGKEVYDPYISIADAFSGVIEYRTVDKNNTYDYKNIIEEDYETALKIVQEEKKN